MSLLLWFFPILFGASNVCAAPSIIVAQSCGRKYISLHNFFHRNVLNTYPGYKDMIYYALESAQIRARLSRDALSEMLVDPSAYPETEDMSNWLIGSRDQVDIAVGKKLLLSYLIYGIFTSTRSIHENYKPQHRPGPSGR